MLTWQTRSHRAGSFHWSETDSADQEGLSIAFFEFWRQVLGALLTQHTSTGGATLFVEMRSETGDFTAFIGDTVRRKLRGTSTVQLTCKALQNYVRDSYDPEREDESLERIEAEERRYLGLLVSALSSLLPRESVSTAWRDCGVRVVFIEPHVSQPLRIEHPWYDSDSGRCFGRL